MRLSSLCTHDVDISDRRTANASESYTPAIRGKSGDMISHRVRWRICQPRFLLGFQRKAVNTSVLADQRISALANQLFEQCHDPRISERGHPLRYDLDKAHLIDG